jgi:hypothetical protein
MTTRDEEDMARGMTAMEGGKKKKIFLNGNPKIPEKKRGRGWTMGWTVRREGGERREEKSLKEKKIKE